MSNYKISEINIYPVKSCGRVSVKSAKIERRGLQHDRRWLLVDEDNMFITQRHFPKMTFINIEIQDDCLIVADKRGIQNDIVIPFGIENSKLEKVVIWEDVVDAKFYGNEINKWFSDLLDEKLRLAFMPDETERKVSNKTKENNAIVSFADGYPFLILGEESLNLLNSKLDEALPMSRFRTNFVFTGGSPHDEDTWYKFKIGENIMYAVKPCTRCTVTTVNEQTAIKGKEPLKTLSTYRLRNNKILFGMNLIHETEGVVNVGDGIEILSYK